jgi:hypothetical protein
MFNKRELCTRGVTYMVDAPVMLTDAVTHCVSKHLIVFDKK